MHGRTLGACLDGTAQPLELLKLLSPMGIAEDGIFFIKDFIPLTAESELCVH